MREAKPHLEALVNRFLDADRDAAAAGLSVARVAGRSATRRRAQRRRMQTLEDVIEQGMFICGSADTVAQQLETSSEGNRLRQADRR